jgi:hypothetical protein
MAVYNSRAIANGAPVPGFGAGGGQIRTQYTVVDVPVGATTTDTLPLFYLPDNAIVQAIKVKSTALGGATSIIIGDGGFGAVAADNDRYLVANNITTAGGVTTTSIAATGCFFRTRGSANRLLVVMAFSAGTVATAGTVEVNISYTVEEPQQ